MHWRVFHLAIYIGVACATSHSATPHEGTFYKYYWYERGREHGNPFFNSRFRVNAPESVIDRQFKNRSEVRGNGMMQILLSEELTSLAGAELVLELWGGHPGTANKRVTINGRTEYKLPEIGTADAHCTHNYPVIPLKITDLVNGYNAIQFACDQGSSFWGHFIVDNAAFRVALPSTHPHVVKAGLALVAPAVKVSRLAAETIELAIAEESDHIACVWYQASFEGYDENGDGNWNDWHGFTKNREPEGWIGRSTQRPFAVKWDASMLPRQSNVSVRALVTFKETRDIALMTAPTPLPGSIGSTVRFYRSTDLPKPFWSRASKRMACTIDLDCPVEQIEAAELHVVIWDGGAGDVKEYFMLNNHFVPVASGRARHDVIYSRVAIEPRKLKRGTNRIELLSNSDHHGIEVLLPGPALAVRLRKT